MRKIIVFSVCVCLFALAISCSDSDSKEGNPSNGNNCTPNCEGKECGDDGCGGNCGTCGQGKVCVNNSYCQSLKEIGGVCKVNDECISKYCLLNKNSKEGYCSKRCYSHEECPINFACNDNNCLRKCFKSEDCEMPNDCFSSGVCIPVNDYGNHKINVEVSGKVSTYNGENESWDSMGGMPDPFFIVKKNGKSVYTSKTKNDSFSFSSSLTVEFYYGDTFTIEIYDEDVSYNDTIYIADFTDIVENAYFLGTEQHNVFEDLIQLELSLFK